MTILWMGGEDIDLTSRSGGAFQSADTTQYRAAYARGNLQFSSYSGTWGIMKWPAAYTSFWFSARIRRDGLITSPSRFLGFNRSGSNGEREVLGFRNLSATNKLVLAKYNNVSAVETVLQTSTADMPSLGVLSKWDVAVDNYGANGRVRVWIDGTLLVDYTGDLTIPSGPANLDGVRLTGNTTGNNYMCEFSELNLADEDTRVFSGNTLFPNGAGSNSGLVGDYTMVDEAVINDADVVSGDTAGLKSTFAMSNTAAGSFIVKGLMLSARCAKGVSGPGSVRLGFRLSGQEWWSAPIAVDTAWATVQVLLQTNPLTNNRWTTAELDAIECGVTVEA